MSDFVYDPLMQKGTKVGRLTAVERIENTPSGNEQWLFVCECGKNAKARLSDVSRGFKQSCGCLRNEKSAARGRAQLTTHGMFYTTEYNTWAQMIQRCTNPRNQAFKYYGARGITVCRRWSQFENFIADMGPRPPDRELDRIDNDKGYSPGNCRWATLSQQAKNKRYLAVRKRDDKGRFLSS
jgi:hypothetical protein